MFDYVTMTLFYIKKKVKFHYKFIKNNLHDALAAEYLMKQTDQRPLLVGCEQCNGISFLPCH